MAYLLDTQIIIAGMKGQPAVRAWLERTPLSNLILSPIVLGELEWAAENSAHPQRNQARLAELVAHLPLLRLGAEVSRNYARISAHLERQGTIIASNDLWIAAHAITLDAVLVTDTSDVFAHVPDLALENWLAEPPR